MTAPPNPTAQAPVATVVLVAGVVAAVHVGKLPPAIPVWQAEWGLGLVEAGFLLSLVQVAGMVLGLVGGAFADRLGLRQTAVTGLLLLGLGSFGGALGTGVNTLLAARALEGIGFLMVVLPCPGLLRQLVQGVASTGRWMGVWGAYMPLGASLGLLLGPWAYGVLGWRWTWVLLGVLTVVWAWVLWRLVPPAEVPSTQAAERWWGAVKQNAVATLRKPGPWCLALGFWVYSGQWLAVVGFLPTVYSALGWSAAAVGWLSALAAAVNLFGNIGAGVLVSRGVAPARAPRCWRGCWRVPTAPWVWRPIWRLPGWMRPGPATWLCCVSRPWVGWCQVRFSVWRFAWPPHRPRCPPPWDGCSNCPLWGSFWDLPWWGGWPLPWGGGHTLGCSTLPVVWGGWRWLGGCMA